MVHKFDVILQYLHTFALLICDLGVPVVVAWWSQLDSELARHSAVAARGEGQSVARGWVDCPFLYNVYEHCVLGRGAPGPGEWSCKTHGSTCAVHEQLDRACCPLPRRTLQECVSIAARWDKDEDDDNSDEEDDHSEDDEE